jgi:hypothetical protein
MPGSSCARGGAALGASAVLLLCLAACSGAADVFDDAPQGEVGLSDLTISNSNPATGDATLTEGALLTIDADGGGLDELELVQILDDVTHEVVVRWDTATHAIYSASHIWGQGPNHGGPDSGFTMCFPGYNDCDPAKIVLDLDARTVTFSGQVLADAFGGQATCTLDGRVGWSEAGPV